MKMAEEQHSLKVGEVKLVRSVGRQFLVMILAELQLVPGKKHMVQEQLVKRVHLKEGVGCSLAALLGIYADLCRGFVWCYGRPGYSVCRQQTWKL